MREEQVERVVERLRGKGVFAHVHREGVFRLGIRIVLPDGREAVWDDDGAAGLEAQILRDGVLVGFVPLIEGSADFDEDRVVATIAGTVYP
jgi:hypothetical protein